MPALSWGPPTRTSEGQPVTEMDVSMAPSLVWSMGECCASTCGMDGDAKGLRVGLCSLGITCSVANLCYAQHTLNETSANLVLFLLRCSSLAAYHSLQTRQLTST